MTAKQFLELLAASMPGTGTAARRTHLVLLAPRIAVEVKPALLTKEVAIAIAPDLPERPLLEDILQAIRSIPFIPPEPPARTAEREAPARDPDEADRQWWRDRIARWRREERPEVELAQLRGALRVLTGRTVMQQGRFYRRPDIIEAVEERIDHLEAEGIEAATLHSAGPMQMHRAAPPPRGPNATARPDPPARGATAAPLRPEVLEQMRMAAGVPPAISREEVES